MISAPIAPSSGDKISASWMRALVNYVRAIKPIAGPGIRTLETPNGTILSCPIKPRPAAKSADNGCWKIVSDTREEEGEAEGETVQKPVRVFANQFYLTGNVVLKELELEDAVEDFVCQGELDEEEEYPEGEEYTEGDRPFVALKVPATTNSTEEPMLVGYKTIDELIKAQDDPAYVVKPLYKFTHDGGIKVDFRNCPMLQVAEVLS